MSKETGGPAFPIWHETSVNAPGLTIRDYFAAKVMQGLSSSFDSGELSTYQINVAASSSYEIADAMLKARSE